MENYKSKIVTAQRGGPGGGRPGGRGGGRQ